MARRKYKITDKPVMAGGFMAKTTPGLGGRAPVTLRMEAFGRKDANNGYYAYTEPPSDSLFPGRGTTDGGLVILPPEAKTPSSGADTSFSYLAVSRGAAFGAGVPDIDTGLLDLGYSWLNGTGGELLFRSHDAAGAITERFMLDSFGDIWFESDSGFWGTFTHQNTADRVWTFPDETGTVQLVGDPIYAPFKTVDSDYTASGTDYMILCDATPASFSVFLPPAADVEGLILVIKKIEPASAARTVTINADGAELIDHATTKVLTLRDDALKIQSDGVQWRGQ